MWNEPTKERLAKIPGLYETEGICTMDKLIYLHFFIGDSDWYIAEYDGEDGLFWGFAILNGDYQMSEWGYVSFEELKQTRIEPFGLEIDCEIETVWQVCKASEIEKIKEGNGWR